MIKGINYNSRKIETYMGNLVSVFDPDPDSIDIRDIAHALSLNCRWGGHVRRFYSVAQHSLFCAEHVQGKYKKAALLHDATEAYMIDLPRPIKLGLPEYKTIEKKLMKIIAKRFRIPYPFPDIIKRIDKKSLEIEWWYLRANKTGEYADWFSEKLPSDIEADFLRVYDSL